jgi:hypothetical protein
MEEVPSYILRCRKYWACAMRRDASEAIVIDVLWGESHNLLLSKLQLLTIMDGNFK